MRKPTESLGVKHSSNQAGTIHQTDNFNQIQDTIKTALLLQRKICDLMNNSVANELFAKEILRMEDKVIDVLQLIAPIMGQVVIDDANKGLFSEKGGEL